MSIPEYKPRAEYIGANNTDEYSFDFKITSANQILTIVTDAAYNVLFSVRGSDITNVAMVSYDPINGKGYVKLAAILANGYFITILLAPDAPVQLSEFRNKSDFTLRRLEAALDAQAAVNQRLMYLATRALRLGDLIKDTDPAFNTTLPINSTDPLATDNSGRPIVIGYDNKSLSFGPTYAELVASLQTLIEDVVEELLADAGGGLPAGGVQYALLEKLTAADSDATWTVPFIFEGISARFGQAVNLQGQKAAMDWLFNIQYTLPGISLSGSSNVLREKGNTVAAITLSATLTRYSDPLHQVEFYQGATQIGTTQSVGPGSTVANQAYASPFSDNISFSARVRDINSGTPGAWVSAGTGYSFVYPYFYGAGAAALGAGVAGLTKDITNNTNNYSRTITSAGAQKLYIAYPAAYGAITQILDQNLFDVTTTFTGSLVNITGLDGTSQSYRVYESNNLVVAGAFAFQFKK